MLFRSKVAAGVARLKEFLAERPKDPLAEDVQMAIADLFFARDDFAAALPEYQQLITRFPQSRLTPRANYRAGWCEVKTGKPTDALAHFQQAFNTAGSDAALAADALFKIGDVQFEAGQLQEASASYQRLVSSYPASPLIERALFQLGHVYQRMQNADVAVHVFQSLVEQFPTGERAAEAQFQIGLIQASTGNETAAREAFAQVTKKFPNHRLAQQSQLAIGESF